MDRHLSDADLNPDPNFHADADPDPDPGWHQNNANPHVDPTQLYTCWKIRYFYDLLSQHCHLAVLCLSHQCQICHIYRDISILDNILKFFRKKIYLINFFVPGSGYGKMMRIRPDPDPIRIHNSGEKGD